MKHSTEPWGYACNQIVTNDDAVVADDVSVHDCKRITECVNALAGIDDPKLYCNGMSEVMTRHGDLIRAARGLLEALTPQGDAEIASAKRLAGILEQKNDGGGMLTFEGAFLGQILLPDGKTVLDHVESKNLLPAPAKQDD